MPAEMTFDARVVALQSWWLASELVRRHPELQLVEMHPRETHGCLVVVRPLLPDWTVMLDRGGSIYRRVGLPPLFHWETERAQVDRHWGVKTIERRCELQMPPSTPAATPTTVAFRLLHQLLLLGLDDRRPWDVRHVLPDALLPWDGSELDGFPSARAALEDSQPIDPFGDPMLRFWRVLRADDCVAIVESDGWCHLRSGQMINLMALYGARHRSIAAVAVDVRERLST